MGGRQNSGDRCKRTLNIGIYCFYCCLNFLLYSCRSWIISIYDPCLEFEVDRCQFDFGNVGKKPVALEEYCARYC